jgi:membrane-bound lytic murein transglycosylase D
VVRRGDTLSHIAERYHTTVTAIAQANRLRNTHFLSTGQDLLIPQGRSSVGQIPSFASEPSQRVTYTVRKGDTLSEIAERYGTSARMLQRWNRLGTYIHPGQRLTIYTKDGGPTFAANGSGPTTVRVQRGDTLWDIARHHGVSLSELLRANGLSKSDLIRPGDVIKVPKRSG